MIASLKLLSLWLCAAAAFVLCLLANGAAPELTTPSVAPAGAFRRLAAQAWTLNAAAHVALCGYMVTIGTGDLSFSGPFSNDEQQTVNVIAVPLTFLYYGWALWAHRDVRNCRHKRFAVPVAFYLIGWVTVWPTFLTAQQFVWPTFAVLVWQFVFWCETTACVAGALVLVGKDNAATAKRDED